MTVIALIGGIGCGKSTVAELLAARGALVVDADVIAREVVKVGSPTLKRLVESFGDVILAPDGSLDRGLLASLAFKDPTATGRLNEILHPEIGAVLVDRTRDAAARSPVVVVAIPLYRPEHREALSIDTVVCVDCEPQVALERLVTERGFSEDDANRRMAAQGSRDERLALADVVLDNSGTREQLVVAVDELFERLVTP
jgi:dephospho-CoA kinase